MEHIGFIGIGAMGWHMATNLIRAGHRVTVYDVDRARQERFVRERKGLGAETLVEVISRSVRSADVHADKHVECYLLSTSAFDELGESNPIIKMTLLQNLLRNFYRMLTMVEREVTTLSW